MHGNSIQFPETFPEQKCQILNSLPYFFYAYVQCIRHGFLKTQHHGGIFFIPFKTPRIGPHPSTPPLLQEHRVDARKRHGLGREAEAAVLPHLFGRLQEGAIGGARERGTQAHPPHAQRGQVRH